MTYTFSAMRTRKAQMCRGSTRLWRQGLIRCVIGISLLSIFACDSGEETDLTPPRVLRIEPAGPIIPVDAQLTVTFSEAMAASSIVPENLVLVLRSEVDDSFLSDIGSGGLNDLDDDGLVPLTYELSEDNTVLTLTPERALDVATAYSLVISEEVRDASGNPIADSDGQKTNVVYDLTTDDGPPSIISHNVNGTLPANQKRFWIKWNQPVQGVSVSNLRIEAQADGSIDPVIEAVLLNADHTEATLLLADRSTCERMTPNAEYALVVGPGLVDIEGDLAPQEQLDFTVGGGCDVQQHVVLGAPEAIALEDSAVVRFNTNKPSSTTLFFGVTGGASDCLGSACPIVGDEARAAVDLMYAHEVAIDNLALNVTYQFTVLAEDDVGYVASASGTFTTSPVAPIAVNEIFPAPEGDDDLGEFVELVNYSDDESVDLSGFTLLIDGDVAYVFGDGQSAPTLTPGGFVLATQPEFNASQFPGLDQTIVYASLSKALQNSSPQSVELRDASGRPISIYSGYAALSPKEGQSIERIHPDDPDEESSFCYSNGGPSPGQPNTVLANGC